VIVISRMKDEGIVIGDEIIITVEEIEGDQIHLNIEHPPQVPVEKKVSVESTDQVTETSALA